MSKEETFIDKAPALVKTAAKVAKLQGLYYESRILEVALSRMVETGYDNWDGGTTFYTLLLEIPIELFSEVEFTREQLEKSLRDKIGGLTKHNQGHNISEVIISPTLLEDIKEEDKNGDNEEVILEAAPSFWQQGYFRLFISHSVAIRSSAHKLKEALAPFQVASFVAHDDIEPVHEWQSEIESALRTMDALVAIISPEFSSSKWCDQEVGFALGRGKLVIPISKEATPYGFIGKIQGLNSSGLEAKGIAEKVVEVLIQNETSSQRMTEVLVEKLVNSGSWDSSRFIVKLLEKTPKLTPIQAGRLLSAIEDNIDVGRAFNVPEKINALIKRLLPNNS